MDERQVATNKVVPYLKDQLKWPGTLISEYGRVPIQVGTSIAWADFVCYIAWRNKPSPYLLVEVKQEGEDLEQWVPQAESYALILGAPFFAVTDGAQYRFYLTGKSQGDSVGLEDIPPLPSGENLPANLDFVQFPPELDPLVELFFQALRNEPEFLGDTIWHSECLQYWNKNIFVNLDGATRQALKKGIEERMMIQRPPNRKALLEAIDDDFTKVTAVLRFIADFRGDPVQNLNLLLDRSSNLHIRGAGLFIITQLLAAAHPGDYVVLEENVARALKDLRMTDVVVKTDIANGYIYANDVCKRIYRDKLQARIEEGNYGLAAGFELVAVHNFLWHYYAYVKRGKAWSG